MCNASEKRETWLCVFVSIVLVVGVVDGAGTLRVVLVGFRVWCVLGKMSKMRVLFVLYVVFWGIGRL